MKLTQRLARSAALALALGGLSATVAAEQVAYAVPAAAAAPVRAPALSLGHELVAALNASDRPALERFLAAHLSRAALMEQSATPRALELLRLRLRGPVEIVESSGLPDVVVLSVRAGDAAPDAEIVVVMSDAEKTRAEEIWLFADRGT